MTCISKVFLLAAFITVTCIVAKAQTPEMLAHFDYDQKAPLGMKELGVEKRGDVTIHDITYVSPKGGVVPSYLVVPKGKGRFAAVIWGHWYWDNSPMRNRKQFLDEAVALAPTGVVSLLTDGPVARPGHEKITDFLSDKNVEERVQQVIDMRRGVDLLLARKDVDPKRIAFVGHSYNAAVGAFLSGIDKRIGSFVLMAGGLSDEVTLNTPEVRDFRQQLGPEKFDAYMKKYSWADQGKYVSHAAPAMVFLQFATQERFITPERAKLYAAVVSEPKRFKIYEAPHALNAEARSDRLAFLAERLKLKPLSPEVIGAIPELYQPPPQN
jgi:dienelactone hydrolase